ncbi:hypothetical protein CJA_3199 [Cellvibrio japonicus Ueda107]|uniref:Uncharacterized protein n=1 Tax=Cellvibrio japonicus (strain Ueda107) TaxID=498211 RepID=B3PDZ7_CELJU|nr:hypothetical protein CJA_3199 [Cellvibrio japonicus Ueda107]
MLFQVKTYVGQRDSDKQFAGFVEFYGSFKKVSSNNSMPDSISPIFLFPLQKKFLVVNGAKSCCMARIVGIA